MGSGCFSPNLNKGQLDIQVLEAIYEQAEKCSPITIQSSYSITDSEQTYRNIKQKIMKKGHLKKLCDYLSTHRFRICDNLMHNLRIVTQSKQLIYKYVCILILDQLLNIVPSETHNINMGLSLRTIQTTRESLVKVNEEKQSRKIATTSKRINTEKSIENRSSFLLQEITSFRFEEIYFKLITFLLKQNDQIYSLALKNLVKYVGLSTLSFQNVEDLNEITKVIIEYIQIGYYLENSLQAFYVILQRVKPSFYANNINSLKIFIDFADSQDSFSGHTSRSNSSQMYRKMICSSFLINCSDLQQFQSIFVIFLEAMDQKKFEKTQSIEMFVFEVLHDHELRAQYSRALFMNLLAYVCYPQNQELVSVWLQTFSLETETDYRTKFKYILHTESKINSIKKITKWSVYDSIVEPQDLLKFDGDKLIKAYTMNLFTENKEISGAVVNELINLCGHFNSQNQLSLLKLLIDVLDEGFMKDSQKFTVLAICTRIGSRLSFINLSDASLLMSAKLENRGQINEKILSFMGTILCKLTKQSITNFIWEVCGFFNSIVEIIKSQTTQSTSKLSLTHQYQFVLTQLPKQLFQGIIMALTQHLNTYPGEHQDQLISDLMQRASLEFLGQPQSFANLDQYANISNIKHPKELDLIILKYSKERQPKMIQFENPESVFLYIESRKHFQQLREFMNDNSQMLMSGFRNPHSTISVESVKRESAEDRTLQNVLDIISK